MKFWWRFCDVFKWAHGISFSIYSMLLIAAIDSITLEGFLRFIAVILYSAVAGIAFMAAQEYINQEMIKTERVRNQETLYHAIRDSFIDSKLDS